MDTISWDICADYANFSGEPVDQVREKAARGAQLAANAWNSLRQKTFKAKADRFYVQKDHVYIYDHLLAHLNHQFIREWYQRHLAPLVAGKRVLDFGAGIGVFAIQMAMDGAQVIYHDVCGVHRDFAAWRRAHVQHLIGPLQGSLRFVNDPFDQEYDLVFSYATLEHLEGANLSQVLAKMNRGLAAGGLMMHFIDPHAGKAHPMHRRGTIEQVTNLCEKFGYELVRAPEAPLPGVWRKPGADRA